MESGVVANLALVDHGDELENEVCKYDLAELLSELEHFLGFSGVHDDAVGNSSLSVLIFFKNRFEQSDSNFRLLDSESAKRKNAEVDNKPPVLWDNNTHLLTINVCPRYGTVRGKSSECEPSYQNHADCD